MKRIFITIFLINFGGFFTGGRLAAQGGRLITGFTENSGYFYQNAKIEGLAGNGRMIVSTMPGNFWFRFNKIIERGKIRISLDDGGQDIDNMPADSFFLPGAVVYNVRHSNCNIEVFHTAPHDKDSYILVLRIVNTANSQKSGQVIYELEFPEAEILKDKIVLGENCIVFNKPFNAGGYRKVRNKTSVNVPFSLPPKGVADVMMIIGKPDIASVFVTKNPQSLVKSMSEHYTKDGLILNSPADDLNRAVNFMKFHLQLGYDWPNRMVCDIFRWRDVWSRDFGSGFGPGALACGMYNAVESTFEYELSRHSSLPADGYKADLGDASKGGSAEGIGLIMDVAWKYYLHTGDLVLLKKIYTVMKPWVDAWIARDYDRDGLIVDTTEWMDHSRFFRLPEGIQTLYSNVLFSVMLESFGKVCGAAGTKSESDYYSGYAQLSKDSINKILWNPKGFYDNYRMWGNNDASLASAANSLAILYDVADRDRAKKILASIRKTNWRKYGSITVWPPMKFVGLGVDHNAKPWPWWEAKEAKARFLNDDTAAGMTVLKWCTDTMKYKSYPGLMEEYIFNPDTGEIQDFAGHSFISAAGSTMDCIVTGLLGFSYAEPGIMQISPNVPAGWSNWSVQVPLYKGVLKYTQKGTSVEISGNFNIKKLRVGMPAHRSLGEGGPARGLKADSVTVNGEKIKYAVFEGMAEIPLSASGEKKIIITFIPSGVEGLATKKAEVKAPFPYPKFEEIKSPPNPVKNVGIFYQKDIPRTNHSRAQWISKLVSGMGYKTVFIGSDDIISLSDKIDLLVIVDNILPVSTDKNPDIRSGIESFLEKGGRMFLCGAYTKPKGTLGENGSLFEYMFYTPALKSVDITGGWKFAASDSDKDKNNKSEAGYINKYFSEQFNDSGWKTVVLPQSWEKTLGAEYDGYGWYRKKVQIPASWQGGKFYLALGEIDDTDWTYLNGTLIGRTDGWQIERRYLLEPDNPAYEKIKWGQENIIAVQVLDSGGGGGMHKGSQAFLYEDKSSYSWQNYDERTGFACESPRRGGIASWGGGKFFGDWSLSLGLFGFQSNAQTVQFDAGGMLAGLASMNVQVTNIYTDFSAKLPWRFIPLAYTVRTEKFIESAAPERYPCAVLLEHTSGGRIIVISPEILDADKAGGIIKKILQKI